MSELATLDVVHAAPAGCSIMGGTHVAGSIDDAWLLSAVALLGCAHPVWLDRLIDTPDDIQADAGLVTFNLWLSSAGDWSPVTVDTRVPCASSAVLSLAAAQNSPRTADGASAAATMAAVEATQHRAGPVMLYSGSYSAAGLAYTLLSKAVAKTGGSFQAGLHGGRSLLAGWDEPDGLGARTVEEALRMLTGLPAFSVDPADKGLLQAAKAQATARDSIACSTAALFDPPTCPELEEGDEEKLALPCSFMPTVEPDVATLTWNWVRQWLRGGHVVAAVPLTADSNAATELNVPHSPTTPGGLLRGLGMPILFTREMGSLRLVKLANPWADSSVGNTGCTWRGAWGPGSSTWSERPDVEAALIDDAHERCSFERDATDVLWMVWDDLLSEGVTFSVGLTGDLASLSSVAAAVPAAASAAAQRSVPLAKDKSFRLGQGDASLPSSVGLCTACPDLEPKVQVRQAEVEWKDAAAAGPPAAKQVPPGMGRRRMDRGAVVLWPDLARPHGAHGNAEGAEARHALPDYADADTDVPLPETAEQWATWGVTAGLRHTAPGADVTGLGWTADGDPGFFMNPQFILKLPPKQLTAADAVAATRREAMAATLGVSAAAVAEDQDARDARAEQRVALHSTVPRLSAKATAAAEAGGPLALAAAAKGDVPVVLSLVWAQDTPAPPMRLLVVRRGRGAARGRVWDVQPGDIVADSGPTLVGGGACAADAALAEFCASSAFVTPDGTPAEIEPPKPRKVGAVPVAAPQPPSEVVLPPVFLSRDAAYTVITFCATKMVAGSAFLRVLSGTATKVTLQPIPLPLRATPQQGGWRAELSTTGGALFVPPSTEAAAGKAEHSGRSLAAASSAWVTNPQYVMQLVEMRKSRTGGRGSAAPPAAPAATAAEPRGSPIAAKSGLLSPQASTVQRAGHALVDTAMRKSIEVKIVLRIRERIGLGADDPDDPSATARIVNGVAFPPSIGLTLARAVPTVLAEGSGLELASLASSSGSSIEGTASRASRSRSRAKSRTRKRAKRKDGVLPFQRRVEVAPGDWCQLSDFQGSSIAVATARVPLEWLVGKAALLVVPSSAWPGMEASYELLAWADTPAGGGTWRLRMRELVAATTVHTPGKWTVDTAGGCHLHDRWQRNPKWTLEFVQPVAKSGSRVSLSSKRSKPPLTTGTVQITVARPRGAWSKRVAKDPVAAMLGVYVVSSTPNPSGDRGASKLTVLAETPFTPADSVQLAVPLQLVHAVQQDGGTVHIMPATWEPKQTGPFVLSVAAPRPIKLTAEEA